MRKYWFTILAFTIAVIFLTACSPQPTPARPSPNAEQGSASPTTPAPTPTPTRQAEMPARGQRSGVMACEIVSISPTQGPEEASMFPPVSAEDWVTGSDAPALTIIEYSDFQCPYCALLAADLRELLARHPEDVRVVYRHFPLPSHPLALIGAYGADAAGLQGKFWEMHDLLFEQQAAYAAMTTEQFEAWLVEQAAALGLDEERFLLDMKSEAVTRKVNQAQQHGLDIGIPGTPLVLLNGQYYQGPRDTGSLESILQLYQLEDRQFTDCPEMVIDEQKEYIATIQTTKGDLVIQLFADQAPLAVNSFVYLARQGWFDNTTFHRVLPGFIAQAGDPSGTGLGGPGYSFADEITSLRFDKPGRVGMANAGPGSNGSQFFITYQATPNLDGRYTVFGEVIEGMDVLQRLTPRNPAEQMGLPPGEPILSIEISEQ